MTPALKALRRLCAETHTLLLTIYGTTTPEGLIDLGAGAPALAVARALADARRILDRAALVEEIAKNPDPRD
jgi:hypothetical protein